MYKYQLFSRRLRPQHKPISPSSSIPPADINHVPGFDPTQPNISEHILWGYMMKICNLSSSPPFIRPFLLSLPDHLPPSLILHLFDMEPYPILRVFYPFDQIIP